MHTDSETTDISLLGFMPYMIVVSLEMSDEPEICEYSLNIICNIYAIVITTKLQKHQ